MGILFDKGTTNIEGLTKSNNLIKRNKHNRRHSIDLTQFPKRAPVFLKQSMKYNYNPINNSFTKEKGRGRYADVTHFNTANLDSNFDKKTFKPEGKKHISERPRNFLKSNHRVRQSKKRQEDTYGSSTYRMTSISLIF